MSPDPEPLWSTEQLAEYLGVAVQTVHALRRRGEAPPAYRVGRVLRFEPGEVTAWLHELREDLALLQSADDDKVEMEVEPVDGDGSDQPGDDLLERTACIGGSD